MRTCEESLLTSPVPKSRKMATNAVTPAPDADLAVVATKRQYPDLSEKVRSDLLILNRDLQLEARLIDDLLDLTRISTGKISLRRETTDVHSLMRSVIQLCQRDVDRRQIDLSLRFEALHSQVLGDTGRLQQVFWNL